MSKKNIQKKIEEHFDLSEIKEICFNLDIEFENLSGTTRKEKSIELVEYFHKHNKLQKLIDYCIQQRPLVNWGSKTLSQPVHELEKLNFEFLPPIDNQLVGQQISQKIISQDIDYPTIHIKVQPADLNYEWEDLADNNVYLMLQVPFYVYSDNNINPRNQELPLRILFTTNEREAPIELSVFEKIKANHSNLVDFVIELGCDRKTLIQRFRQKPYHIWHHKGANTKTNATVIELANQTLLIDKIVKTHTSKLTVPNIIFLQSLHPITELKSIPAPISINMPSDIHPTQIARLMGGFYDRIVKYPIEVALLLARRDQYISDKNSDVWKAIKLRGNSPFTKIYF